MRNIEIATLKVDDQLESKLEELVNNKARDFELLTSFGPVTHKGAYHVFFIFQKIE